MLKKLTALSLLVFLTSCQNLNSPKIAYKLSDEDTKKWIIEVNKVEQCVFAKEYQAKNSNNFSNEEKYLYKKAGLNTLANIIGMENIQIINNDPISQKYAMDQYHKFNHNEKATFDQQWCEDQKRDYNQALKQLKVDIKKFNAEQAAKEKEAERQRKAEADFYSSKEGQAYLAQQQLMVQQQNLQNQIALQQQAQRVAYERQLAEERAAHQNAEFQNFSNTLINAVNNMNNSMAQTTQMINSITQSMPRYQYQPQQPSSTTCYRLTSGIVRCNHQ